MRGIAPRRGARALACPVERAEGREGRQSPWLLQSVDMLQGPPRIQGAGLRRLWPGLFPCRTGSSVRGARRGRAPSRAPPKKRPARRGPPMRAGAAPRTTRGGGRPRPPPVEPGSGRAARFASDVPPPAHADSLTSILRRCHPHAATIYIGATVLYNPAVTQIA